MREGHFRIAWDLFKGALELHLSGEKRRADPYFALSSASANFILRAQIRYHRFMDSEKRSRESDSLRLIEEHGEDENFCHFFLFRDPLEIPNDLQSANSSFSGLIIILNLALLEHFRNPSSRQVISLYRLASSLLSGSSVDAPLEAVILNNAGVWYQQSGDTSLAEKYMNRLSELTQGLSFDSFVATGMRDGVQFNLDWFANPRYKVSPAA